jgi:membrane protein YqaA with SNARE-associated domain
MVTWTNKQWGAVIGAVVLLVIVWLGISAAALVILGGIVGYFIGSFLDGELDLSDVQRRAQRRG